MGFLGTYNSFFNRVNGVNPTPKGPTGTTPKQTGTTPKQTGTVVPVGGFKGGLPGLGGESWDSYTTKTETTDNPVVEGPSLPNKDSGGYHYSDTEEPKMTVDEVYGKGNQSIVENQGDYSASSNEKSNAETNTFGKQDDIAITPVSATENKGIVNNSTIQSVEGLGFQQKDKESQDVLDSKKKRDEVEAEDKSNQMRDKIKAAVTETKEDVGGYQLGDRNEDVANAKAEVDRLDNERAQYKDEQKEKDDHLRSLYNEALEKEQAKNQEEADYQAKKANMRRLGAISQKMQKLSNKYQEIANKDHNLFNRPSIKGDLSKLNSELNSFCRWIGVEPPTLDTNPYQGKAALEGFQTWENSLKQELFNGLKDFSQDSIDAYKAEVEEEHLRNRQQYTDELARLEDETKLTESRLEELDKLIADSEEKYYESKTTYNNLVNNTFVGEETATPTETTTPTEETPATTPTEAETAITTAKDAKAEVDRLANEKAKYEDEQKKNTDRLKSFYAEAEEKEQAKNQEEADYQAKKANAEHLGVIGRNVQSIGKLLDTTPTGVGGQTMVKSAQISLDNLASKLGIDSVDLPTNSISEAREAFQSWENSLKQEYFNGLKDFSQDSIDAYKAGVEEEHLRNLQQFTDELDSLKGGAELIENRQEKLKGLIADNEKKSNEAQTAYNNLVNNTFVGEEATTPTSKSEIAITTAKDAIDNSTNASEEEKVAAKEALTKVGTSVTSVQDAALKLTENLDNVSDEDINTYMTALKELNKNYEDANDKVNFFKRTDFNKQYVTAIAKANDFDVTLADGSKMSFSEFSAKMATKSPRIAAAMYNAKADRLEQEGHPTLAKMERNKAKMVGNWFGSKFTFADDLVRDQFNQMAETNMRATYAAYNNVLNNPEATTEQKAEARSAIDQANSLMTASAALKASTGFWSGIGDGMGDGAYGTTNPGDLNAYQKTLSKIDNFTKAVLGLGVTPGANRAYQNMYYLAGDDVDKSALFNKDFNNDGFALCQEYGNSATANMIVGFGELSTGVALMFNPATSGMGASLIGDSIGTTLDGLYGVASEVNKSKDYTGAVLGFFEDAKDIAEKSINVDAGNEEVVSKIKSAISQIENFKLGSEEVNDFNNWLEGSGSNTTDAGKFNQALTYEEWLKLIEADPTMQEYAKKLIAGKKNAKENNADAGVNS